MSTLLIQSGTLDDIADAIRAKTGSASTMTPLEMPTEIASIGGGVAPKVCTNAQISNTSSYLVASTDLDAFDFDYLLISLTISGTEYLTGINVSNISSGVDFIVNSHRGYNVMKMQLTSSTVTTTYYTGSYTNIYCTIYGLMTS